MMWRLMFSAMCLALGVCWAESGCEKKSETCAASSIEVVVVTPRVVEAMPHAVPSVSDSGPSDSGLPDVWPGELVGEGENRRRVWSTRTTPVPSQTTNSVSPQLILPQVDLRLQGRNDQR